MTTQSTLPVSSGTTSVAQANQTQVNKSVREVSAKVTKATSGILSRLGACISAFFAPITRYFQIREIKKDLIASGQKVMKDFNANNERATSSEHTKVVHNALAKFEKVLSTVDANKAIELTKGLVESVQKEFNGKTISFKSSNGSGTYSMTQLMLEGFYAIDQLNDVQGVTAHETISVAFEQGLLEGSTLDTYVELADGSQEKVEGRQNRGVRNILENKMVQQFIDAAVDCRPREALKAFDAQLEKSAGIVDRSDVKSELKKAKKAARHANKDVNGESFKTLVKKAEETLNGNEDGIHELATNLVVAGILSSTQEATFAETVRERMQNPVAAQEEDEQPTPVATSAEPSAPAATWLKFPSFKMPSLFGSKTAPAATTATESSTEEELVEETQEEQVEPIADPQAEAAVAAYEKRKNKQTDEAILDLPVPASTPAGSKPTPQRLAAGAALESAAKKFKATHEETRAALIKEKNDQAESELLNGELRKLFSQENANVVSELRLQEKLIEVLEDMAKLQAIIGKKGCVSNSFTIDFKLSDPNTTARAKQLMLEIGQALEGEHTLESLEGMMQDLHVQGSEIISQIKEAHSKSALARMRSQQLVHVIEKKGLKVVDSAEHEVLELNCNHLKDQSEEIQKMIASIESFDPRTRLEKAKAVMQSAWSKLPSRPAFERLSSDERFFVPNLRKSKKAQAAPVAEAAPQPAPAEVAAAPAPVEKTTRWTFFKRKEAPVAQEAPVAPAVESIAVRQVYNDPTTVESTTAESFYGEARPLGSF